VTIVEFLNAQLDEDERVAGELEASGFNADGRRVLDVWPFSDGTKWPRRWNPVRVLDDVAATRAVVALHKPYQGVGCGSCSAVGSPARPCLTLRLLVSVYSDQLGYQEEWRP
jgi:hypothetical protein